MADFDLDTLMDELEEKLDAVVYGAMEQALPEVLSESLADFEFQLKNGTVVRPRQRMKVLSPDKSKLLICYGGLRVDGRSLIIQTRISCWECIADYPDREAAIEALNRVKDAMAAGIELLELT